MMHLITDNLGWKLASLAISVMLWMAVVGDPELTTSVSVPIEFKNIPKELEISSEVPDRIRLEVHGPAGKLAPASLSQGAVVLDLAPVQRPGEKSFDIDEHNLTLPGGVSLSRAIPSQVRLRFERQLVRQIPVLVRFANPPQPGYRIVRQEVLPDRLSIVGPESRVQQCDAAETDPIDLSPVISEASFNVHTFAPDPQVRFVDDHRVTVKVLLEKVPDRPNPEHKGTTDR